MNSLNSVLIEGNVTRDAELKYTPSGSPVCTFSIAVNRSYKKGDDYEKEVSFIDVETWGKLAESCAKNLTKGRGTRVVGRIKQERWNDTDGKARSKIKIVGEHVEFKPVFKNSSEESVPEETDATDNGPPPDDMPTF